MQSDYWGIYLPRVSGPLLVSSLLSSFDFEPVIEHFLEQADTYHNCV